MTSSSSPALERGLDAMLIVYALLDTHPASAISEQFIRARAGWFTTATSLLEAKAVLTKVYGVDAASATQKLATLIKGLVEVLPVDVKVVLDAMRLVDTLGLDLSDAVLLSSVLTQGATKLATDDRRLAQASRQAGLTVENPVDDALRQQMAQWELANLPAKGLPRILRQIYGWLSSTHPQAASEFWSQTGGGSHLP